MPGHSQPATPCSDEAGRAGLLLVAQWIVLLLVIGSVRAERLPVKVYTTADGLPRDYITRIVQDSRGFLWFCTIEGLSRFDGYGFKNYGTEQGLPSRYVNDFMETRSGVYWVATDEGLCRFNPDPALASSQKDGPGAEPKFVIYLLGESSNARFVATIFEDHTGAIWCGTGAGLYRLDQIAGQWVSSFIDINSPVDGQRTMQAVSTIIEDRQGALWFRATSGIYRRRADGRMERYTAREGLPSREIYDRALLEDRHGRIWVGTRLGLYQLVPAPQPGRPVVARVYTTKDGLASDAVVSCFQSSDGRLWAAAGGLNEFVPDGKGGGRFRAYTVANGLSDVNLSTLAEDRDGNLWLGTETTGAMKLTVNGLTTYDETDGLARTRVRMILNNQAGEICVIGNFGIINRFDGKRFTAIPLTLPPGKTY